MFIYLFIFAYPHFLIAGSPPLSLSPSYSIISNIQMLPIQNLCSGFLGCGIFMLLIQLLLLCLLVIAIKKKKNISAGPTRQTSRSESPSLAFCYKFTTSRQRQPATRLFLARSLTAPVSFWLMGHRMAGATLAKAEIENDDKDGCNIRLAMCANGRVAHGV